VLFPAPKYRLAKDHGLVIHNVTQQDARRHYMCRAMDMDSPIPETKIMNITLKVKSMFETLLHLFLISSFLMRMRSEPGDRFQEECKSRHE
jgi:hypothetical protein